ncbi:MAG: flavodoxin family protein [Desulfobacterales bacterium]
MHVTGFVGSPRKGGNTDHLVRRILESVSEKGADSDIVYLNDLNIKGCQACMQCKEKALRCAVDDDMQKLYPLIESSDVLVLGSPIYMGNITGMMKTFIDRWYAFAGVVDGKKLSAGKRIFLVLPYGREDKALFNHVAKQIGQMFKYLFGAKVESWLVSGTRDAGAVLQNQDLMDHAWQIGVALSENRPVNRQ